MDKRPFFLSGLLLAAGIVTPTVRADEPDKSVNDKINEMQAQLHAQQAQIQQLQTQLKQTQDSQQQAVNEQADTIHKLYQETHKQPFSLDMPGVNGGWDRRQGFYLQSDDGQSVFHPFAILDGRLSHSSKTFGGQFEATRHFPSDGVIEVGMDGSLFSRDFTYNITVNYSQANGTNVQYAWAQYVLGHDKFADHDLAARAGLFKDPAFKETGLIGDPNQLMITSSLADTLVGGVAAGPLVRAIEISCYGDDARPWRFEAGIDDGPSRNQYRGGGVIEPTPNGTALFGTFARADYKFFGDWIDTTDMTGKNHAKDDLLDVGVGIDLTGTGTHGIYRGTIDAQYLAAQKWILFAALYGDHFDAGDHNDWGGVVQVGYFINPATEVTARYSLTRADPTFVASTTGVGESTFHELAVGANYFLGPQGSWGNHAKLSIDFTYLPNGAPADPDIDYNTIVPGKEQFVLRTQFQLWL